MNVTNSLELVQANSSHLYKIKLILRFQTRFIGTLDKSGEGTLIIHRKKEHILKKINAVGINFELLSSPDIHYKRIKIFCDTKELISTREYYLIKGRTFQFSNKGYELQSFVPIDELNLYTIRKFEIDKSRQGNLFDGIS